MDNSSNASLLLTTVRTYKMRSGRLTASQRSAMDDVAPAFDLAGCSWSAITDRATGRPIVADIGFGFGDSVLHYAVTEPETFIVGVEVHVPGVGAFCREASAVGLTNIGVLNLDARQWLSETVPDSALAGVRLFFPDPWPKKKHHKRRFIRRPVLDLLASRCAPGAFFHIATDIADYAEDARAELHASPDWALEPEMNHRRGRPVTRFEQRAISDARPVFDLLAYRT